MWFRKARKEQDSLRMPLLRIDRRTSGNESGQVLLIGAIVSLGLAMVAITVANVGMMTAEKIHLQDSVDAAAYSAAVVEARYMNLSAYINRAMVANYNSMAFNTALWATVHADQKGVAVIADLLYKISEVLAVLVITIPLSEAVDVLADGLAAVHELLASLNSLLRDLFAQDETDLNQYLEVYNVYALTMYQGLLYASMQSDRYRVIREVSQEMDPEIVTTTVLASGAEAVSYDEMARAIDWVVDDTSARSGVFNSFNNSFNQMTGTDSDTTDQKFLLAGVTEASLDKFVAGRDRLGDPDLLRRFNTQNILEQLGLGALIELPFEIPCIPPCIVACEAACTDDLLTFSDPIGCITACPGQCVDFCDVDIQLKLGAEMRDFQENSFTRDHVPFISRQRMREVNFFGIEWIFESRNPLFAAATAALRALGIPNTQGTTSGDKKSDLANAANATVGLNALGSIDPIRAFQCTLTGTGCQLTFSVPTGGLNAPNMQAANLMLPIVGVVAPPFFIDDHWPGSGDVYPIKSHEFWPEPATGKIDPPRYLAQIIAEGVDPGVPRYDWIVDIDDVGFPHYHFDETGAQARPSGNSRGSGISLAGPSIAVAGVKRAADINGLRGLGIGLEAPNDYSMTAIARGQVYYLRNPNRPNEQPSMFNPHWVPRLAPIDNDDTPTLLREILPFVSGMGVPISPTH